MAFPPALPSIQHVTINSEAQRQLSWRRGASSTLIPNVLDFDTPPPITDRQHSEVRQALGLAPDDTIILQPTRVVPRKGIEHAIALVGRLGIPGAKLIVSHETEDEGPEYQSQLLAYADEEKVDLRFIHARIAPSRSVDASGQPIFELADIYAEADFITYPSTFEGFGNALIEAFYYRRPVLVNRYSIFVSDIEPKGFDVVTMDGYLSNQVVDQVRRTLADKDHRQAMVDRNFNLGRAFFSYEVLRRKLGALMANASVIDS
jgi:glycosyltransferase involved in cell wall biosynthesis